MEEVQGYRGLGSTSLSHKMQFENQQIEEHRLLLTVRILDPWLEPDPIHHDGFQLPSSSIAGMLEGSEGWLLGTPICPLLPLW